MHPVERLRRDHAIFRMKLEALESALSLGEPARMVVRDLCVSIALRLEDHRGRERRFRPPHVVDATLAQLADGHAMEARAFQSAMRAFAQAPPTVEALQTPLTLAVTQCRFHMDAQERALFPAIAWESRRQPRVDVSLLGVNETTRVRRIVERYPRAAGVFHQHFIDPLAEGNDPLDEVAFRHRVEPHDLLAYLHDALRAADAPPRAEDHRGARSNRARYLP